MNVREILRDTFFKYSEWRAQNEMSTYDVCLEKYEEIIRNELGALGRTFAGRVIDVIDSELNSIYHSKARIQAIRDLKAELANDLSLPDNAMFQGNSDAILDRIHKHFADRNMGDLGTEMCYYIKHS